MDNERIPKSYKDVEQAAEAVKIFNEMRVWLAERFGDKPIATAHLASCVLEEALSRMLPDSVHGDMLVGAGRLAAPDIVNEIAQDEMAEAGLYAVPEGEEVH